MLPYLFWDTKGLFKQGRPADVRLGAQSMQVKQTETKPVRIGLCMLRFCSPQNVVCHRRSRSFFLSHKCIILFIIF